MARIEVVRETGRLMIIAICDERFMVLPERPETLSHVGPLEELPDGRKVGTGLREVNGVLRNVAWHADDEEVARIQGEWREAVANSTIEVTDEMLAEFAD